MFSWTSFLSFKTTLWTLAVWIEPLSYLCHAVISLAFLCCCSVTKSCLTLCDSMDCSMPSLPVLYHLLEFAQISNSHPLSQWCHLTISSSVVPFSLALSLSQHQGLFQRIISILRNRWPKYWSFSFILYPTSHAYYSVRLSEGSVKAF